MSALVQVGCTEHMVVAVGDQEHGIKLAGSFDEPYFCGKDVCTALGYANPKLAVQQHVESTAKKPLCKIRSASDEGGSEFKSRFLGSSEPLTFNQGNAIYITETGLRDLLRKAKTDHKKRDDFKKCLEIWLSRRPSEAMDFFTYVKGTNLAIDLGSNWFKDLWFPLSRFRSALQCAPENKPLPFIITENLLDWMG